MKITFIGRDEKCKRLNDEYIISLTVVEQGFVKQMARYFEMLCHKDSSFSPAMLLLARSLSAETACYVRNEEVKDDMWLSAKQEYDDQREQQTKIGD